MQELVTFKDHVAALEEILNQIKADDFAVKISDLVLEIVQCFTAGGKLLFFGNGGSSMDGAHIAAEFTGRFLMARPSLPAFSLADNVAAVTSISNDFGYESVFARQIEGLAKVEDIAIGLSTSGTSINVINGLICAKKMGLKTAMFTNSSAVFEPGTVDHLVNIPSMTTARIQEVTLFLGHFIAGEVEKKLYA